MRPARTNILIQLPLALVFGCALIGCAAEEPSALPDRNDNTQTHDFKPAPPADMAHADDGRVEPPSLDAVRQATPYDSVAVHGTGEPNSTVLIENMAGGTVSADVLPSGRFCADIPLKKNAMNNFTLRAIDLVGNMSDPVSLSVRQEGTPPVATSTPRPAENMAIGGVTASTLSWNHSNGDALKDGDDDSYAGSWQRGWSFTDNVVVRMSERRQIDTIKIKAPASCPLTASFSLWVSNADAPSDPGTAPMQWQKLRDVPVGGAGTEYVVHLSQSVVMSHVSLYFDRGYIAWGDEVNCGNNFWGAYYAFSEIQAISTPNTIPPPPSGADTCGGGGN